MYERVHLTIPKQPRHPREVVIPNRYRVQKKQWGKWPLLAKMVFNETYFVMTKNVDLFMHPKAEKPTKEEWKTTAWNAAWTAAEAIPR